MNGSPPIDDLFRSRLAHAEAEPPPEVWAAVSRHRNRRHGAAWYRIRHLAWALLLLLVGAAIWSIVPGEQQALHTDRIPSTPERAHERDAATTTVAETPDGGSNALDATPHQEAPTQIDHTPAAAVQAPADRTATSATTAFALPQRPVQPVVEDHVPTPTATPDTQPERPDAKEDRLGLLSGRAWQGADDRPAEASPVSTMAPFGLALARASWWIAAQVSTAGLSGGWQGPHAETLNSAETWHRSTGVAVLGGYRWTNGFSLGSGLSMVSLESRFLFAEQSQGTVQESVDTTWVGTPAGILTYYTWNVDTVLLELTGAEQQYSATNRYTCLRIPLELGWRQDRQRFRYGARGALQLEIPMARNGRTLIVDADGLPRTADLSDARSDARFTPWWSASAALELGYLVCDRWAVLAGPYGSLPLGDVAGAAPAPRTSEFGAWARLEYLFGKRVIPAPAP